MSRAVYIAGKVSGLPKHVYTANFAKVEGELRNMGYEVINPVRLVVDNELEEASYDEIMEYLLRIIRTMAGAIVMLPDWVDSEGAKAERKLALELELPIFYYNDEKHI